MAQYYHGMTTEVGPAHPSAALRTCSAGEADDLDQPALRHDTDAPTVGAGGPDVQPPDAPPGQIHATLTAAGIDVSPTEVPVLPILNDGV